MGAEILERPVVRDRQPVPGIVGNHQALVELSRQVLEARRRIHRVTVKYDVTLPPADLAHHHRSKMERPSHVGRLPELTQEIGRRRLESRLSDPGPHLGRIYELTGPRSQDMHGVARQYSDALNREITYLDIPHEDWERELRKAGLPEHVNRHLVTMAELHRAGRYDRLSDGVERVTGRPAMSVRDFVSLHADEFGGRRS